MRTSLHFKSPFKSCLDGMKPVAGEVNKTQFFAIYMHKATIHYINDQEGCPYFLFNHFTYLDHKQFMKISH